ncbi:MAG: sugar phosphate isomerase/epimerase family protein [Candidatus Poribacteria bacterium]
MFKLGVISDEVSQDFQTVVDVAKEFNLDSIEIRSVWDKPPQDLTDEDIDKMKQILAPTGIKIIGVASPFYKCDIDNPEERKEHIGIFRQCVKLVHAFDARIIRSFAFWKTERTEELWDEILSSYDEPKRIAEDEGIIIGMENEASTSLATAKLTRRFIDDIDSPNIRAIWDPANEAYAEDGEKSYPDAYNRLKDVMIHVHAKDAAPNPETGEMESVPVGDGIIGWQQQLQALVDDGYDGHICLETHWRPTSALSEDLLNRPGGSAFSEAGEEASRICLKNIFEMMGKLKR